jgi:uncharacterized membrane protein YjjP (DUF1212 family)
VASGNGDLAELQAFVLQLGAVLDSAGEPVFAIEERMLAVAAAYGVANARVNALPTSLLVTMGDGAPVALEMTPKLTRTPRLDQISAIHQLVEEAEQAAVTPSEGLERIAALRTREARFGPWPSVLGLAGLSTGICLILHPAPRDVACAAILGGLVGVMRTVLRNTPALDVLMPVLAAFAVSLLTALATKHGLVDPGLRAMISALVVFVPGSALTTGVLELAAGEMISGAARLTSAIVQLGLLAFGILVGIEAGGISSHEAFSSSAKLLGQWAPWLGVLVFAIGVMIAYSAPAGTFPGLVIVLYAAWIGQVIGNHLVGGYVSGFIGALVMTPVATMVARTAFGMPAFASFLPGFWLLVPGAMGLIGLTELAAGTPGSASAAAIRDMQSAVASIFGVAFGVLCGTQLQLLLTSRGSAFSPAPVTRRSRSRAASGSGDDRHRP